MCVSIYTFKCADRPVLLIDGAFQPWVKFCSVAWAVSSLSDRTCSCLLLSPLACSCLLPSHPSSAPVSSFSSPVSSFICPCLLFLVSCCLHLICSYILLPDVACSCFHVPPLVSSCLLISARLFSSAVSFCLPLLVSSCQLLSPLFSASLIFCLLFCII